MRPEPFSDGRVTLEPADANNVHLLVAWTLDPVAQGPFKRVPDSTHQELTRLFLDTPDRRYFLVRAAVDGSPLGRFYWRAWRFRVDGASVDWELNLLIADPARRGRGYGTAVQRLAAEHLLSAVETRSVFAYTHADNVGERRALEKAGFRCEGPMPVAPHRVPAADGAWILYTRAATGRRAG
jgi:RimJ/RimL family protein N-acetyltransferase